jgi:photosystem II stability/assembly factor-like uncharacterized protein
MMRPVLGLLMSIGLHVLAASVPAQGLKELGPAPLSIHVGRVSALACSPSDPDRLFVAGADGGVWRTTDGGQTWIPLTGHMPTTSIGALAMDPTDEQVLYAGTGEANFANHSRYGLGIFKSLDGGETWSHIAMDTFAGRCISKIVIDPDSPTTLYAGVTRAGGFPEMAAAKGHPQREGPLGVFKSEDGGLTWGQLAGGLPDQAATDLAMSPADPRTLYTAIGRIFGAPENGIYKTTDAGQSWQKLGGGLPQTDVGRVSLAVAPGNASRLYALFVNPASASGGEASTKSTWRSEDAGATWTRINFEDFQSSYGWYLSVVSVSPADPDTVIMGGLTLRRSLNAGESTNNITTPHVDNHAIAWDASGRLVVGDDGGVHRSDNLGNSWMHLNTGLGTVQFYAGLSTHPTNEHFVIGGTQDNGTNRRSIDSKTWDHIAGGDGGWTQLDWTHPNRLFAESQGTGNLYRSLDGGESFDDADSGINGGDRNCFLPPYLIDPSDPDRMLYATHRIYRSVNGGSSWNAISGDLTGGGSASIRALAQSPVDPARVWTATNDGRILTSDDGGQTFDIVLVGNPGWPRVTRELCPHPEEPETLYLAVAAFGADQVRRTRDAGQTWEVLDGDLPDLPVNVVALDTRMSPEAIYAGTDAGLYRSFDDGRTWNRFAGAMPNACIIDLIPEPQRERLIIGTQGRGAWSVGMTCSGDCDGDGAMDLFDFLCFANLFNAQDARADLDADGQFTLFDFLVFQNLFVAGCG